MPHYIPIQSSQFGFARTFAFVNINTLAMLASVPYMVCTAL